MEVLEVLPLETFIVSQIVFGLGFILFLRKRLLRYLRFLQQEEYDQSRFLSWIFTQVAFDKRGSLVAALSAASFFTSSTLMSLIFIMQGILFALIGNSESDPRDAGKKKLVLTSRAKAIYLLGFSLGVFLLLVVLALGLNSILFQLILVQLPPFLLVSAVFFLAPKETRIKSSLKLEAQKKFKQINPVTIGVTGSFGKTSVKNLLGDVMSLSLGPTFWPQAGVNTEMGITREIRERMNQYDKYAIIEMGAYHEGSIKNLCDFTPVNAAIVTAVHLMHLERFGSEEQVYRAKSELPQAVPQDGILVLNGDNAGARKMATEFRKDNTFLYGLDKGKGTLDAFLDDIKVTPLGTSFKVHWKDEQYEGFTKMHGRGALSNILASFTMACALGAKPEMVLAVVRDINPVSNRLEVKNYGSYTQINDAYNSNPVGFAYALEVLRDLPGERRILLTPGMIELGEKQGEENEKIAKLAASVCDLVIVVNEPNRHSFLKGLSGGGMDESRYKYFATRDEGLAYYSSIKKDGDILLLENDLPDVLEFEEKF